MEQTLGKSRVLLESVMALFTEQTVDHENRPQISHNYRNSHIFQDF